MTFHAPSAFCPSFCNLRMQHDNRRRLPPNTIILPRNELITYMSSEDSVLALSFEMTEKTTEFEPILNVPALGSFLLILAIFSFLVQRTSAIEQAADERTRAVEQVRKLKSLALSGDATPEDVDQAIASYRDAYDKVEKLRYVIPGVARITPPPAGSLSRKFMEENEMAAQQFLGIESEESITVSDKRENGDKQTGLSPILIAVLAVVATSQIMLLGLLSSDPMSATELLDAATFGLE